MAACEAAKSKRKNRPAAEGWGRPCKEGFEARAVFKVDDQVSLAHVGDVREKQVSREQSVCEVEAEIPTGHPGAMRWKEGS